MAKRKRQELTLQEKVEVIDFKNKNPATALRQIANKFQCGKTQIQSILRDQQNLRDKSTASGNAASKRASTCRFQDIDLAMLEWFRKARSKNIPVSGPILQQKACAVAAQMGMGQVKSFKWMARKIQDPIQH